MTVRKTSGMFDRSSVYPQVMGFLGQNWVLFLLPFVMPWCSLSWLLRRREGAEENQIRHWRPSLSKARFLSHKKLQSSTMKEGQPDWIQHEVQLKVMQIGGKSSAIYLHSNRNGFLSEARGD